MPNVRGHTSVRTYLVQMHLCIPGQRTLGAPGDPGDQGPSGDTMAI